MTIKEFYKLLNSHDWYFHYSDDSRVNTSGQKELDLLKKVANSEGGMFCDLLDKYESYIFSGPSYGTVRKIKPELEEFV